MDTKYIPSTDVQVGHHIEGYGIVTKIKKSSTKNLLNQEIPVRTFTFESGGTYTASAVAHSPEDLPIVPVAEYSLPYETRDSHLYKASKMVEARIKEALEGKDLPEDVASHVRFEAKVLRVDYSYFVTRVYSGSYLMTGGRRAFKSNRSFIASKRNQAIDLERALAFIIEKATEEAQDRAKDNAARSKREQSYELAKALREELGSSLRLDIGSTDAPDKVEVVFKKTVTADEARALIKTLKELA